MAVVHREGCPGTRVEKYVRTFFRDDGKRRTKMQTSVTHCVDCGGMDNTKPKAVED